MFYEDDVADSIYSRRNATKSRSNDSNIQQKPCSSQSNASSLDDEVVEVITVTKEVTPTDVEIIDTAALNQELQPSTSKASVSASNDMIQKAVGQINSPIISSAEQVTKKLIHQLASMDKHNLKQMIINPNSKFDTVLQTQARKKLREEMRKQLRNMNLDNDNQLLQNMLEPDECIDADKIPEAVFDEIGRVLDINLLGSDFTSSIGIDRCDEDGNPNNTKEDLYLRAEQLLMENSTFLLEDRLNDTSIINSVSNSPTCEQSDVLDSDQTKSKIEVQTDNNAMNFINESKSNQNDKLNFDDHFIDILDETDSIDPNISLPKLHNLTTFLSTDQVTHTHVLTESEKCIEKPAITRESTTDQELNNLNTESQSKNEISINQSMLLSKCQNSAKEPHENITQIRLDKTTPQSEGDYESLDSGPKKFDLKTKLRNLNAMKSSAAEKKLKKLSIQTVRSNKSSKSKKRKRLKEKRKERSKSHRDKNYSSRTHRSSSSSTSQSRSSSSCSSTSDSDDDNSKHSKKSKKSKKSSQTKHLKSKKKTANKPEHSASARVDDNSDDRRKVENVNISNAFTRINEKCLKKLDNSKTNSTATVITSIIQEKLSDDKERFRATLEALKTEGDDEECKKIILNIEQLIEDEFQNVNEGSEIVLPAAENICDNVKSVTPEPQNTSENSTTIETDENSAKNIPSITKHPEQQMIAKSNDKNVDSEPPQHSLDETDNNAYSSNLKNPPESTVSNPLIDNQPNDTKQSEKITVLQNVLDPAKKIADTEEVYLQISNKKDETLESIIVLDETIDEVDDNTQTLPALDNTEIETQKMPIIDTLSKTGHVSIIDNDSKLELFTSQRTGFDVNLSLEKIAIADLSSKNEIVNIDTVSPSSNVEALTIIPKDVPESSSTPPSMPKEPANNEQIECMVSNTKSVDVTVQSVNATFDGNVAIIAPETCTIDNDSPINHTKQNKPKIENKEDLTKKFKFFGKKSTKNKESSSKQVKETGGDGTNISSLDHSTQGTVIDDTTKKKQKIDKPTSSKTKSDERIESKSSSSSSHKRSRHKHSHSHGQPKKRREDTGQSKDRSKYVKVTTDRKIGSRGKRFTIKSIWK